MAIFAISDLHLSFTRPVSLYDIDPKQDIAKPMELFGWDQHYNYIRDHWLSSISEQDTVLIPGDVSWALKLEVAMNDFGWIAALPGRKIISPGNHCYYASSKKKMRDALSDSMEWLDADITVVEDKVIAATRGWNIPPHSNERDLQIYNRQVGRLCLALEQADKEYPQLEKIVMLHFPPVTASSQTSGFMDALVKYGVKFCVYGHLHGAVASDAIQGCVEGVELRLVSCDALNFIPIKIL